MGHIEDFTFTLAHGFSLFDRHDGTFVLTNAGFTNCLIIDEREAAIIRDSNGLKIRDIAYRGFIERSHLPLQGLTSLCQQMAARGMLEGKEDAQRLFRSPGSAGRLWLFNLFRIPLFRQKKAWKAGDEAAPSAAPSWISSPPFVIMLFFAASALLLIWDPPGMANLFSDATRFWEALVILYVAIASGLTLREWLTVMLCDKAGIRRGPAGLDLVLGIPAFNAGSGSLITAPRDLRLTIGALSLVMILALCSLLRIAGAISITWHPFISWVLDLISAALLISVFIELYPFGHTLAFESCQAFARQKDALETGFSYLCHRMFRRFFAGDLFEGEKVLITYGSWALLWFIIAFSKGVGFLEVNNDLLISLLASTTFSLQCVLFLLFILIVFTLGLISLLGIILIAESLISSLIPGKRFVEGIGKLKSGDPDLMAAFIGRVPFFSGQPAEALHAITSHAKYLPFKAGEILARQGDAGDHLFMLAEGRALVKRKNEAGVEKKVAILHEGDCFGETSLIEARPCSATVKALTKGALIAIAREDFLPLVESTPEILGLIQGFQALHASPYFSGLEIDNLSQLLNMAEVVSADPGQVVIRKGDLGDRFYIVLKGTLDVMSSDERTVINTLREGEPFGEIALLSGGTRTVTVVARTSCLLIALNRETFGVFLSNHLFLGDELERLGHERMARYDGGQR
jgi:CRP-like cAMP-binding protein